jgi:hypothetical protein
MQQEFEWVKNEYLAREQMALGKIKGAHFVSLHIHVWMKIPTSTPLSSFVQIYMSN